jgi:Trk K+ transport system NAD-binding subunit
MNKKEFLYLIISKLRFPLILLIVVYTIAMLGLVLIPTYNNEGQEVYLSFFDAFFIVIYTSTTVGFGETPYAWTNYQKFWMAICTIGTVTAWLISVGRIISIMQDPIIKIEAAMYFFRRKVRSIKEPFYIVGGFGNTGEYLSKILVKHGHRVVIIEEEKMIIENSKYIDYKIAVPTMYGDISNLDTLKNAGILNPYCQGIILTTNCDEANLKAALNAKILNPNIKIISRSNHFENKKNLKSFNTDLIVSPYSLFAKDIKNRMLQDKKYIINKILTNEMFSEDCNVRKIPTKGIVIMGFHKFGKMLYKHIKHDYKDITILDKQESINLLSNHEHISAEGFNEEDLKTSNIENAETLILTDKDDHKNLSAIITAKRLNEKLFTIAVLNKEQNYLLYSKLKVDMIIKPHELMVREIFPVISEPLLKEFLSILGNCNKTLDYLKESMGKIEDPVVWSLRVDDDICPPITKHLENKKTLSIEQLISFGIEDNDFPLPLIILKNKNKIILPKYKTKIAYNDIILFIGSQSSKNKFDWTINNNIFFEESLDFSKEFSLVDFISK